MKWRKERGGEGSAQLWGKSRGKARDSLGEGGSISGVTLTESSEHKV